MARPGPLQPPAVAIAARPGPKAARAGPRVLLTGPAGPARPGPRLSRRRPRRSGGAGGRLPDDSSSPARPPGRSHCRLLCHGGGGGGGVTGGVGGGRDGRRACVCGARSVPRRSSRPPMWRVAEASRRRRGGVAAALRPANITVSKRNRRVFLLEMEKCPRKQVMSLAPRRHRGLVVLAPPLRSGRAIGPTRRLLPAAASREARNMGRSGGDARPFLLRIRSRGDARPFALRIRSRGDVRPFVLRTWSPSNNIPCVPYFRA